MTSKLNKQTKKTTTSNKAKQIKDKQNKVNRINKARSQDFLRRGAIQQGEGPNEPGGGGLGCLRLHFERLEKLVISQTFNLQKKRELYFFGMALCEKKKSRKKVINPYYSLGLIHDLCIMIF